MGIMLEDGIVTIRIFRKQSAQRFEKELLGRLGPGNFQPKVNPGPIFEYDISFEKLKFLIGYDQGEENE